LAKIQVVSSRKFAFKEEVFENVLVVFIYEGKSPSRISLEELTAFLKENFDEKLVILYPCFSKNWFFDKVFLDIALKLSFRLKEAGVKTRVVYPSYERSFTLIPSSKRYLILEANIEYNQRWRDVHRKAFNGNKGSR